MKIVLIRKFLVLIATDQNPFSFSRSDYINDKFRVVIHYRHQEMFLLKHFSYISPYENTI